MDTAATVLVPGLVVAMISAVMGARPAHPWHAAVYAAGLGAVWAAMEHSNAETERALIKERDALQSANERLQRQASFIFWSRAQRDPAESSRQAEHW